MSAKRKPRLLVISATYAWAEPRKKLAALAGHFDLTCLTARRFTSALGTRSEAPDEETAREPLPYRLVRLPVLGRPRSTTKYLLAGLGRAVRAHPADLVLVESEPWALVRWQAWRAARRHLPGARFGEFSWENVSRPGLRGRLLRPVYRAAAATADFVIAGNREAGELFRAGGLDGGRLLVSPQLGVDETRFRPPADPAERAAQRAALGHPAGGFLVGFAGRLEPEKGLAELLAAVRAARTARPGADVRLCLLGSGSLGDGFARVAAREPWLTLHGPRSHAEMAGFMRALDLFVLPSREVTTGATVWREQFGHVLIEAMACGTPVLGSDSGAIPEVIGDPAMTFPWREGARLTAALGELTGDPARLAAAGAAGRARVLERYTNAALARAWADFLYGLPGPDRPSSPAR